MTTYKGTDQAYLLNEQYKDSSNLRSRIHLHRQYSTNTYGWTRWVFDYVKLLPPDAHVLELGCGPCDLWLQNLNRIPKGWTIFLSDLSPGMLEKAQDLLFDRAQRFTFQNFDAQSIPHEDNSLDAVIANHMLYHVPDLEKALSEIARVLKPTGRLFAATNGSGHMKELRELRAKFFESSGLNLSQDRSGGENWQLGFSLENGDELLRAYFPQVALRNYVDSLRVTSSRALFDYVMSSRAYGVDNELSSMFYDFLKAEMQAANGVITIEKETGLFQAWDEEQPMQEKKHRFAFIEDDPDVKVEEAPMTINLDDSDTSTKVQQLNPEM